MTGLFKTRKEEPLPSRDTKLADLSYDKLLVMRNDIEAEILSRGTAEIDALKEKLTAIASAQGLSLADLFNKRKAKRKSGPKYRNPDNPDETWSGRGKVPAWLQQKLEAGADKKDFTI